MMRCCFLFYKRLLIGDIYYIYLFFGFINWRFFLLILGVVEFILVMEDMIGCYKLYEDLKK